MSKSQRVFRVIWRINAVLILAVSGLVACVLITFLISEIGVRVRQSRDAKQETPVVAADPKLRLAIGTAESVPGTNVLRAELMFEGESNKLGSGSPRETRNILFIEPGQKAARWLLPNNDQSIIGTLEINDGKSEGSRQRIATAVLVVPASNEDDTAPGTLMLFDASGRTIVRVADNVRRLHHADESGGEVTVLYERNRRLVSATFDPRSLAKRSEQEIDVPALK